MKKVKYLLPLLIVLFVALSYVGNFRESKQTLYQQANETFVQECHEWTFIMSDIMQIRMWGRYDKEKYQKKETFTILSATDTIVISTRFYFPPYEKMRLDFHTYDLIQSSIDGEDGYYDLHMTDSIFQTSLADKGIHAEVATVLEARDLATMFPSEDSMNVNAPIIFSSKGKELEKVSFVTDTVGIGTADVGLLCAQVYVPSVEVWKHMDSFGWRQVLALLLAIVMWIVVCSVVVFRSVSRHMILLGNSCLDLKNESLYLWSGECRPIPTNQQSLIKMLLATDSEYRLSKEDICQTLWKRDTKDGQALYNTTVSGLRKLFIADDESIELKTLPKEGIELVVHTSLLKRARSWHYFVLFLKQAVYK